MPPRHRPDKQPDPPCENLEASKALGTAVLRLAEAGELCDHILLDALAMLVAWQCDHQGESDQQAMTRLLRFCERVTDMLAYARSQPQVH